MRLFSFSLYVHPRCLRTSGLSLLCGILVNAFSVPVVSAAGNPVYQPDEFLETYCGRCHNDDRMSANWSLTMIDASDIVHGEKLARWESILRTTRFGEMPPANRKQPDAAELDDFLTWLKAELDSRATFVPEPGRATLRRLNRNEYANSVRDLLALEVDVSDQLPADDTGYGFDNIADVLSVSPILMEKYLRVAERISRMATGQAPAQPYVTTYVLPKDGSVLNQGVPSYDWRMSDDLPLSSRGGGAFDYFAPYDGRYVISGYLNSNTNNEVDRLEENRVELNVPLTAGFHSIGMTFRKQLALDEWVQVLHNTTDKVPLPVAPPESLTLDFVVDGARVGSTQVPSYYMSPRYAQHNFLRDVLQIDVDGPYDISGRTTTAAEERVFSCRPGFLPFSAERCAKRIFRRLARLAWRTPVTDGDLTPLMKVYQQASVAAGAEAGKQVAFEQGVSAALQALLVSPRFLFLTEPVPEQVRPGELYRLSDSQLAARLALFLWSSLPDDELLSVAEDGRLRESAVLTQQVSRMLADPKAAALTENFAGQWLYLRNLEFHRADVYLYPDFDAPLRQAMRKESELFFASVLEDNASILNFLDSDYTYLNERLAQHYGIDGVSGPAFRRVSIPDDSPRGGLLGQGSILTVTSYGNHTSVVKRGKWILDNLLAAPPPPPPPDVPALTMKTRTGKALNAREQLALHSEDPACRSCHVRMDPLGLALENFDAIGNFRFADAAGHIDASATMPDGTAFDGLPGLQDVLMQNQVQFADAFTQKLMTYALGRGLEAPDMPAVRRIVQASAADNYAMHSIIMGIIKSDAFNLRRAPGYETASN